MEFYIDIEDCTDQKIKVVTNIEDETIVGNIRTMVDNDADSFGHLRLEEIPDEEVDCYNWDDDEQELLDERSGWAHVNILYDGIGDFEQPIGLVILTWEDIPSGNGTEEK